MPLLPAEVAIHILTFVPLSSYTALYQVFPEELVDEALKYKVRQQPQLLELVSTNLHELMAACTSSNSKVRNESGLPMEFLAYDTAHRMLWFAPDFSCPNQFFRVKDGYVSHGKLLIRADKESPSKVIMSLWDIRKKLPPKRSGTLSGASQVDCREYSEELCVRDDDFMLDGYISTCKPDGQIRRSNRSMAGLISPPPTAYGRAIPPLNLLPVGSPWERHFPNPTCGVFLVEHIALTVPAFLDLFI
ncbi:hypothetical protein BGW37DRAFT_425501 [Umbelopsis sp. PMI_123]|nr:hypothetical protein BGW37DRAFT_425501 [Umbelopsis sp. PMI_123]